MTLHQTNTDWPVYEELGRRKGTIIAEAKAADDGFFEKIEYPEGFNGNPERTPGATGCEPVQLHQLKKFKIVSTDGLSDNTKIYYGDEQLKGVTNIQLTLDAEVGVTFLTMTVLAPLFDITLNPELVNLRIDNQAQATRLNVEDIITRIRNELSPVPEENINKDSTA